MMKSECVQGITDFWATVDAAKCKKYIGHLKKVLPAVIGRIGLPLGINFLFFFLNRLFSKPPQLQRFPDFTTYMYMSQYIMR